MIELIRFIKEHQSLKKKIKKLFKRTESIKPTDIIDQAIYVTFEYKNKKSFPKMRNRLSILLRNEVLQNYKNITPILLFYAIQEDLPLFHTILLELCEKGTTKDIQNIILHEFDQDMIIFIIKEMIYLCKIKKKIVKLLNMQILEILFKDLFKKLIGIEPLKECSVDHLDQNLYILYSVLHPMSKKKINIPTVPIEKWYQRVIKDPKKLNQFYLSAFEQNYQKQIYSIKDTHKRMKLIMKIRTPELAFVAKKKLFLDNMMKNSYFT